MADKKQRLLPRELHAPELRWTCPAAWIPPARREHPEEGPLPELIGQERALDALEMGLEVSAPGYNVFVSGIGSDEKNEAVRRILERIRVRCPVPKDHVYVHNFADPLRPRHIALPGGRGPELREALREWVGALRNEVPRLLEKEDHLERHRKLAQRYADAENKLFRRIARSAKAQGLTLVEMEDEEGEHQDIWVSIDGKPVHPDELEEVPQKIRPSMAQLRRRMRIRERLLDQLARAHRQAGRLALRLMRERQLLDENRVRGVVEDLTTDMREDLSADRELANWLDQAAGFALVNLDLFRRGGHSGGIFDEEGDDSTHGRHPGLEVFEINVVRTVGPEGCPTIYEQHPNYSNLFGTVERRVMVSGPGFYHLAVRAGSLLSADGGFLVLNGRDVFKEAEVWRALKRTLQNRRLEIHALESLSPLGVTGVRPEPLPIDVKVILNGDNDLYETLHDADFDFPNIFKVKAEFDDSLPLEPEYVGRFAHVIRAIGHKEGLLPFAPSGLQALLERAVRDAGRRNRFSARISSLADYSREASYFARKTSRKRVDRRAVELAARNFRRQHSLENEIHNRLVLEDVFEIATEGEGVGRINALTVVSLGPMEFGRVARVSATVSVGEESYLSIDREVDLSGPLHSKGVLMLEAFTRGRFGQTRALPIKVSLTFDQSYGPIDGDSASSTEIYALLSALGGLPLRQDVAVTGAVNMNGEVLAVGGVNEKIEGFFELCRARGLTGTQGVVLPASNRDDLMLDREILEAVRSRQFHIWTTETIDQGMALLTGLEVGRSRADGSYPPDSIMGRIETRLSEFERILKSDGKDKDGSDVLPGPKPGKQAARHNRRRP